MLHGFRGPSKHLWIKGKVSLTLKNLILISILSVEYLPLCWFFNVSHIWIELSSLPQNMNLPLKDKPQDVYPGFEFGGLKVANCWSDLRSHNLAVLSSEAVTKACPEGWYWMEHNCLQIR